jgi:hypothetical protein
VKATRLKKNKELNSLDPKPSDLAMARLKKIQFLRTEPVYVAMY